MLVLIKKDESTSVPREVADLAEARTLLTQGFPVFVQNEDGSTTPVETEVPAEVLAEVAPAPVKAPTAKKAARKR